MTFARGLVKQGAVDKFGETKESYYRHGKNITNIIVAFFTPTYNLSDLFPCVC